MQELKYKFYKKKKGNAIPIEINTVFPGILLQ